RRIDAPPEPTPKRLAFEGLEIDPGARRVTVRGAQVKLTVREYALLLFLAAHPGEVFSRAQLMEAVWQSTFHPDTSTVTVEIRHRGLVGNLSVQVPPDLTTLLAALQRLGHKCQPRRDHSLAELLEQSRVLAFLHQQGAGQRHVEAPAGELHVGDQLGASVAA